MNSTAAGGPKVNSTAVDEPIQCSANSPKSPITWVHLLGVIWNIVSPKYLRTLTKKKCKGNLTLNLM